MTQRWNGGRASYRPKGEPINPADYEVALMAKHERSVAKEFVELHHYAATFPASRANVGLYVRRTAKLVGVASFSQPGNEATLDVLPAGRDEGIELGRLVLLDSVPANGETWFLRRGFAELARAGVARSVLSFADPMVRTTVAGVVVMPGHVGTIYQALNGVYTGRGTPRSLHLLADGTVFSEQAWSKLRRKIKGWEYAMRQLVDAGAEPWNGNEPTRVWALRELHRISRTVRHKGNHRYVWGVDRRASHAVARHLEQRGVRTDLPRPKVIDLAAL